MSKVKELFEESILTKVQIIESEEFKIIEEMAESISKAIVKGKKVMLCGNGGSAADAQHLAAEMLIRLRPKNNRESLPAISLAQDTSTITACGNDFGFDKLFERTLNGLGNQGDILLAITTSGNSVNIINAINAARKKDIKVFGFLGSGGGKTSSLCDKVFMVPGDNTGRIQEAHITAGHALMEGIEDLLIEQGHLNLK